jgi:hypothetical protein
MKNLLSILALILASCACLHAADDSAIVDGPNYAFIISAPKGWKLTSTKELQAAFFPVDTSFEKSTVVMYARSADKKGLGVSNVQELNRLDLKGIQKRNPAATSAKIGTVKTPLGTELPVYSFSGSGSIEVVAYAEHEKTITVLVLSADNDEQLKAARPAFDELISSYLFISDSRQTPKKPAEPNTQRQPSRK